MAYDVSLLGANYPDVPAVILPRTGGGNATFVADDALLEKAPVIIVNKTSPTVIYDDAIPNVPLVDCAASFSPVQSGSGDPSPSNVRPILGVTEGNVYRLGKNLFDVSSYPFTDGCFIIASSGAVSEGTASSANYKATKSFVPCDKWAGKTVTLNKRSGGNGVGLAFYSEASTSSYISGVSNANGTAGTPMTFNVPAEAKYIRFSVQLSATDIQIEFGSNSTSYEIYSKETIASVSFQDEVGTVYGGVYNFVTGVLVLTWLSHIVTEDSILYGGSSSSYNGETGTNRFVELPHGIASYSSGGCSDYMKRINSSTWDDPSSHLWDFCVNADIQLHMVFANETVGITSGMTASERSYAIKAWLSEHPITFVLPLATPIEYQLGPSDIRSVSGSNVINSDLNGVLGIQYRADTKKYVDRHDVRINGTSIMYDGVADIPIASGITFGVGKAGLGYGISVNSGGFFVTDKPSDLGVKRGTDYIGVLTPAKEHAATFWGLSKAAGVDLGQTDAELGTYPLNSQLAIQQMLGPWGPKWSFTATCEEETSNFGVTDRYTLQLGDVEINVWEELVVLIYQTDPELGTTILGNNWGSLVIRDVVNNAYIGQSGYIMGTSPVIIRYMRFPNVLITTTGWVNSINSSTPVRAALRSADYVDTLRWMYLHCENSVVKVGTRIDMYIHKFI